MKDNEGGDLFDLPFDPKTMDITFTRDAQGVCHFNIPQIVVHHSPSGMSWGYLGSGCADFALNILELFCRGENVGTVEIYKGERCNRLAWELHQYFKAEVIALMPKDGGTIKGAEIREFIERYKLGPLWAESQAQSEGWTEA